MPCMMHVQHQHYPLWKQWMRNKYGYLIISILQLLHLCRFLDSNRTYCCLILFTLVTRINALPPNPPPPAPNNENIYMVMVMHLNKLLIWYMLNVTAIHSLFAGHGGASLPPPLPPQPKMFNDSF